MDININSSKKLNMDFDNMRIVYQHYKPYILPLAVILVCFLVILVVIVPQIRQFISSQSLLKLEQQKLETLRNNYNFLSNLDDTKSDTDLKVLSFVLPSDKDFVGIMNAISVASAKSGVSIGDFDFSLGDLSKTAQGITSYPSIKMNLNLSGSADSIVNFISELYKTAPLSEVTSIKLANNAATLILLFYYKPFIPKNISDETPVVPFSSETLALIKTVSNWNNSSGQLFFPLVPSLDVTSSASGAFTSSASAGTNPSPF